MLNFMKIYLSVQKLLVAGQAYRLRGHRINLTFLLRKGGHKVKTDARQGPPLKVLILSARCCVRFKPYSSICITLFGFSSNGVTDV
jgi:hypothetical protein